MEDFQVRKIKEQDYSQVIELFCNNIEDSKEYISHGEIQMGIALDNKRLAPDIRKKWKDYLLEQVSQNPEGVLVCQLDSVIAGFVIAEINKDLSNLYGVICDVITRQDLRGKGIGNLLIEAALTFFNENGIKQIFLESGIENEIAHHFFEKIGFKCISKVFMLDNGTVINEA